MAICWSGLISELDQNCKTRSSCSGVSIMVIGGCLYVLVTLGVFLLWLISFGILGPLFPHRTLSLDSICWTFTRRFMTFSTYLSYPSLNLLFCPGICRSRLPT